MTGPDRPVPDDAVPDDRAPDDAVTPSGEEPVTPPLEPTEPTEPAEPTDSVEPAEPAAPPAPAPEHAPQEPTDEHAAPVEPDAVAEPVGAEPVPEADPEPAGRSVADPSEGADVTAALGTGVPGTAPAEVAAEPPATPAAPAVPAAAPAAPGPAVDLTKPDPEPAAVPPDGHAAALHGDADAVVVPAQPAARRALLPVLLAGVLALLLVAAVVGLGLRLRSEQQTDTAREEAVAASRDAARLLFSYDHAKLDEDFERGLAVTTGKFREEYSRTTSEVVKPVALQYKAVVVADVVESAVVEAGPDEVTTLVFLNQATTSTRVQGQQVDQSRVRMRLVERDGRWLVAEVKAL